MTQPTEIPPLLAQMVAGSKKLASDLTLTGRDLLEARAKDAAREATQALVGTELPQDMDGDHVNRVADAIAAPLIKWLRQYDQANDYIATVRDDHGRRVDTAERKLERIEKWAQAWDLSLGADEALRQITDSPDGRPA